jgi:hypothetical protein
VPHGCFSAAIFEQRARLDGAIAALKKKMTRSNMTVRHLTALALISAAIAFPIDVAVGQDVADDPRECLAITDDVARLHCLENEITNPRQPSQAFPPSIGDWRRVRTPDPRGGPDAISIMHTADMSRSDADLAGLALRCAEGGIEAQGRDDDHQRPRARPRIRFGSPGKQKVFDAKAVPPFTALLLPREAPLFAAALDASGADSLAIEVDRDDGPIRGAVALAGLTRAIERLTANCEHP